MTPRKKVEMYSRLLRKAEHSYYLQNKRRRIVSAKRPQPGEELTPSQQVALLQSSVRYWNEWYSKSEQRADLNGAELQNTMLEDVNLEEAYLIDAYLADANLVNAYLMGADLRRADLSKADLSGADLQKASLREADLRWAILEDADLSEAILEGTYLEGAYYNSSTQFPRGFSPEEYGMKKVSLDRY